MDPRSSPPRAAWSFSNFGREVAWIAVAGEGVITTYPLGAYAVAWGTRSARISLRTPQRCSLSSNTESASSRQLMPWVMPWISPEVNRGRLDIPAAIAAWRTQLGLQ